jgi:hypothetical protein
LKIIITRPHPHIKPIHVQHTVASMFIIGTILEVAQYTPYVGVILLCIGGVIDAYEPYIVHEAEAEAIHDAN